MCGRFSLNTPFDQLAKRFKVQAPKDFVLNYNIAPGQKVLAILIDSPSEMKFLQWGLVPFWAKDEKIGFNLINARAETIDEKSVFRKTHRCLISADGFYEWDKKETPSQPYYIFLKDKSLFAFAGIYSVWEKGDREIESFLIITTKSNSLLEKIHDRMPVILKKEDEDLWLDKSKSIVDLKYLLKPYPAGEMRLEKVSRERLRLR